MEGMALSLGASFSEYPQDCTSIFQTYKSSMLRKEVGMRGGH